MKKTWHFTLLLSIVEILSLMVVATTNTNISFSLNGDNEISLFINDVYVEEGATSFDNYDGDITSNIMISGNVNTSKVGTYEILYSIKDSSGNSNSITKN